ncbi:SRPBCC family protein [Streptomyces carpinensis]|uniref:SRPBCC family protein n=1 Tax=Streptomyces carpinensis TaxID=66369 RepID=A0ABV1WLU0_9ACTN|nr:SRPBCC family protein [Streptomyces carpinensis]
MYATTVSRRVKAPPAAVYRVLVDPDAVAGWRVPDGMTGRVHEFDPREGGRFRVSLTYDDPGVPGKSGARTDTYRGRFARLVPDELVVEVIEFESDDDALGGTMTMTTSLTEVQDGTEVVIRHEGIPDAVPRQDNELGTRMALDNLARLVEGAQG